MSENRSIEQIEDELSKARESLTNAVNELAGRLSPGSLAEDAKVQAKEKAAAATDAVKAIVEDAKAGDTKALAILGGSAAAVVGLVGLLVARR